jgi:hypothetical protein
MARRRVHLQGCLSDLQSEYEDTAEALSAVCRGGACVARGALQAHLDACAAEMTAVRTALAALDSAGEGL